MLKRSIKFNILALALASQLVPSVSAQEAFSTSSNKTFYESFIADRLHIGTRILAFSLLESQRGDKREGKFPRESFLGSLTNLEEEQNYAPIYFFLQYDIYPWWGFGISYDRREIRTDDWKSNDGGQGGDGNFISSGPILYTSLQYHNESRYTPYGEIGFALYSNKFEPLASWSEGGIRQFVVEDDVGFYLAGGVTIEIIKHLSLDLHLRYVNSGIKTEYYFMDIERQRRPQEVSTFPIDYIGYGIGIKATF
ncbi:MAG: hypothetical protein ACFCU4_00620 [Puniceicoccaceae bacterium]